MIASKYIRNKSVLELVSRRKVFNLVSKEPGIHFKGIQRETGLSNGVLSYHLGQLVKIDLLENHRDGKFVRYYPSKVVPIDERKILEFLRRKAYKRIIFFLLENETCTNSELSHKFNLSPPTITFHLDKLVSHKILDKNLVGGNKLFFLLNPKLITKTLKLFNESFMDDLADSKKRTEKLSCNLLVR